jgi:hypothetical protein
MNRLAMVSLAIVFASIPLAAQSPVPWTPASEGGNCPVAMHAQQNAGGASILVDSDGHRRPAPNGLHLTLRDSHHAAQIVGAQVTVRGLNGKPHAVQSGVESGSSLEGAGDRNSWETTRTVTLSFVAGQDKSAAADISLTGFTSVRWIRLDSLTFSDGSVWFLPDAMVCRTTPDPFVLVSAK